MQATVSRSQLRQYLTTASEAMEALYRSQLLDPLHFLILGGSVFYSLSPAMHTAAYQVCGLSHDFQSLDMASLEDIQRLGQDPNFGGAAITQPYKVATLVIRLLCISLTTLRWKYLVALPQRVTMQKPLGPSTPYCLFVCCPMVAWTAVQNHFFDRPTIAAKQAPFAHTMATTQILLAL